VILGIVQAQVHERLSQQRVGLSELVSEPASHFGGIRTLAHV
jgi:hypothetical protein